MFNVIILGAYHTNDYDFFKTKTINLLKNKAKEGCGITILTTGDDYVKKFAETYSIDIQTFSCNWELGDAKIVFQERNNALLKNANAVIYFDTGKKEYEFIYKSAQKQNIPVRHIVYAKQK